MDYLTPEQIKTLKDNLIQQRDRLLHNVLQTRDEQMKGQGDALPADSVDLSSDRSAQATNVRLRDREKFLLRKIEKTLKKMESDDYGYCENCDVEIGFPRLSARPVAKLCIDCKEEEEKSERRKLDTKYRQENVNIR